MADNQNSNQNNTPEQNLPAKASDNKAIEQLKNFASKLTKAQKVIIGSIAVGVLGLLIWVAAASQQTSYKVLFQGLEDADASKIVENLVASDIDYELKDNGQTILVPESTVYDTRLKLAGEGLPAASTVGYELFDGSNLGMSEFVQKLNYRRALEGELAQTIQSFDEVKKARVHIVIPEKALFARDQKEPTASVSLHLDNGRSIGKISVEGIQNLIASSVEGMLAENVKVVDSRARVLSESPVDATSVAGLTDAQHAQQRRVDDYLESKIKNILEGVIGVGNTQVSVNSDLDFTRIEEVVTDFNPDEQVVRSEQNINKVSQTADSLSYPYVNMANDEENQIANYEISKSEQRIVQEVGAIKRLTVSVMINGTTEIIETNGVPEVSYIPRSDEEMDKFSEIVRNAIGYDPVRNDQISVLNVPFAHNYEDTGIEDFLKGPWYEEPENRKILFFLAAVALAIALMVLLLRNKYLKERIRIALGLPDKIYIEEELEAEEEETLEEIVLDDQDLLLLPAELPDMLLSGPEEDKLLPGTKDALDLDEQGEFDKASLARGASAQLDSESMSEDKLMSLEIKNKVEDFMNAQPQDAARLVRIWLGQDAENVFGTKS
jgi:flagellar M-ring protein FliF